jgi:hypothetical protein
MEIPSNTVLFGETRIGPVMGVYVRFLEFSYLNFETEFNYLQRGGEDLIPIVTEQQPAGTGEFLDYAVLFDYLQLQLNARPKHSFKKSVIYAIVGLSVNYLLSAKNTPFSPEYLKDFTFSYALGVGYEFVGFESHSLFFEISMNSDISNIYTNIDQEYKFKTYTIRVGMGI